MPQSLEGMRTDVTAQKLDGLPDEVRSLLLDLRCVLAELRVCVALQRLALAHKAGFNPAQLRIPVGQPGGGQWADGDGGDVILIGAQGRGSGSAIARSMQRRRKRRDTLWRMREPMLLPRASERSIRHGSQDRV